MKTLSTVLIAAAAAAGCQDQEMPKPGKEHELLRQLAGDWDATAKFWMDPAKDPMESKGVETAKLAHGGFWFTFEYKGDVMGGPFTGQGVPGYDPLKKKYVGTWIDSMVPMLFVSEGEADKDGKVWTMITEVVDHETRKPVKEKWVSEIKDKDTKVMTFWRTGEKDVKTGEITYKRRKYVESRILDLGEHGRNAGLRPCGRA